MFRLPTKPELNLMYIRLHKFDVGGFVGRYYWSSYIANEDSAWLQDFDNGSSGYGNKYGTYNVRAIREFKSLSKYQLRDFGQMGYIFKIRKLKSGFKYIEVLLWDSIHEKTGELMSWDEAIKSKLTRFRIGE